MIWIYFGVAVVALAAAFVAQLFLPPRRRARIIVAAAVGPSALLALLLMFPLVLLESDLDWLQRAVTLAFWFVSASVVGLIAAIGSELASLALWLRARRKIPRRP